MADTLRIWGADLRPYGYSTAESERIRAVGPAIEEAAQRFGLPQVAILAVAWIESRCQPHAVSSAGAQGIMQVMPSTGREVARLIGIPWEPTIPRTNILVGTAFLRRLADRASQTMAGASRPRWRIELEAILGREPTILDAAWGAYFAGWGGLEKIERKTELGEKIGRYVAAVDAAAHRFSQVERAIRGEGPGPEVRTAGRSRSRAGQPDSGTPQGGGTAIGVLLALLVGLGMVVR